MTTKAKKTAKKSKKVTTTKGKSLAKALSTPPVISGVKSWEAGKTKVWIVRDRGHIVSGKAYRAAPTDAAKAVYLAYDVATGAMAFDDGSDFCGGGTTGVIEIEAVDIAAWVHPVSSAGGKACVAIAAELCAAKVAEFAAERPAKKNKVTKAAEKGVDPIKALVGSITIAAAPAGKKAKKAVRVSAAKAA